MPLSIAVQVRGPSGGFGVHVTHEYKAVSRKAFADPINSDFLLTGLALQDKDGAVKLERNFYQPRHVAQPLVHALHPPEEEEEAPKRKRGRPPKDAPPVVKAAPGAKQKKCDVGRLVYLLFPPEIVREWRQKWKDAQEPEWSEVHWDKDANVAELWSVLAKQEQKKEAASARNKTKRNADEAAGDGTASTDADAPTSELRAETAAGVPDEDGLVDSASEFDIPPSLRPLLPAAPRHPGASSKSVAAARLSPAAIVAVANNMDASDSDSSSQDSVGDAQAVLLAKRAAAQQRPPTIVAPKLAEPTHKPPEEAAPEPVAFSFVQPPRAKVVIRSSLGIPASPVEPSAVAAHVVTKKRPAEEEAVRPDAPPAKKPALSDASSSNETAMHNVWTSIKQVLIRQGEFMANLATSLSNNKKQLDDVVAKGLLPFDAAAAPNGAL